MHYSPFRHCTRDPPLRVSPFLVRLACLIHAANVRSEPGSNPSIFYPGPPLRGHLFKLKKFASSRSPRLEIGVRIAVGQAHKCLSKNRGTQCGPLLNRRTTGYPAVHAFPRSRTPAQFSKSRHGSKKFEGPLQRPFALVPRQ